MRSTMQDVPLCVARIVRHGTTVHGASEVVTWAPDGGTRRATFAQAGRRAAQLAHALRDELGISGDQRVATFQWNNQEHLEAYMAIPAMGAVLHTLNIRLFPEQLVFIANHAKDEVVIVDASLAEQFAALLPEMPTVRHVVLVGEGDPGLFAGEGRGTHSYDELIAGRPEVFDWVEPEDERDAAAMCYTSGTTGDPKGVAYSHRSMYLHSMQLSTQEALGLTQHDRILPVVPMFHANAWGIPYGALMVGADLLMPDRHLQAEPLAALIGSEHPTIAAAVPTIWNDLLHHAERTDVDLSSLRELLVGGSLCPPALMRAYQERYDITILHAWGLTETSPLVTIARCPRGVEGDDAWRYRETQGRFFAGVDWRVVGDGDELLPSDNEAVGEVELRGPWITGAYHDTEADEKFHDGWLRTGDVGMLSPDGFLTLTDRAKDVIKSGGEWISSIDVESAVMAHPDVHEAAVIGVVDERWGERPLVAVVLCEGASATPEELRTFIAGRMARWQVPERWCFVDEVPKTSVGKFDKKVLRRQHADGELDVVELGRLEGEHASR